MNDRPTTLLSARHAITANDRNEPTSFLTCMEGMPWDGLRCHIKSYLSVDKELVLQAEGLEIDDEDLVLPGPDTSGKFITILARRGGGKMDAEGEEKGNVIAPC